MKRFSRLFFAVALGLAALILGVNLAFLLPAREGGGGARPHQVEISRLARAIAAGGEGAVDLTDCRYVTRVTPLLPGRTRPPSLPAKTWTRPSARSAIPATASTTASPQAATAPSFGPPTGG